MEQVWLGCGCFWSAEDAYREVDGVVQTEVGFVVVDDERIEVVQVSWNPDEVRLSELLDLFFRIHDPTEDLSLEEEAARSLVGVCTTDHQQIAEQALAATMATGRYIGEPRTVFALQPVYERADDAHQQYLARQREG